MTVSTAFRLNSNNNNAIIISKKKTLGLEVDTTGPAAQSRPKVAWALEEVSVYSIRKNG